MKYTLYKHLLFGLIIKGFCMGKTCFLENGMCFAIL
jgi:hypothetical protein